MRQAEPSEVIRLGSGRETESFHEEWLHLAIELPETSYFQTPDWILSWWHTLAGRPPTTIAAWRGPSGGLDAVVAISQVRQRLHRRVPVSVPVWINAGTGAGAADHCGWLARPHRQAAVRKWMLEIDPGKSVLLQNLDPQLESELPPGAHPVSQTRCPRCSVSADAEAGYSANFRQQLRSRERKLRGTGTTLRWIDSEEMNDSVLDILFSLHQDRWSMKGRRSTFSTGQRELHSALIEQSAPDRGPAAIVAEHEGRPIGILYGFWWKDIFAYYQIGWDSEWAAYSPGTVLMREAIRMTASREGRVFDFLRGAESFKYRFGAHDRIDTTWLLGRGWSGPVLRLGFASRRFLRSFRTAHQV